MYAYCKNNPIKYIDTAGESAAIAIAAATNFWNPIGWILAGVVAIELIVLAVVVVERVIPLICHAVTPRETEDTWRGNNLVEAKAGDGISEHTNGSKNWDKHSKPRSGRKTTKNRQKGDWNENPNPKKRKKKG